MAISTLTIQRCLNHIKQALKQKGITYSELAERMDVSQVTVARMLNQDDISMQRLLTLAEICGFNGSEILEWAFEQHSTHYFFSEHQDAIFAENPHLYHYFSELFFEQKSPQQIAAEHDLNNVSTYRYLRELENLGLLKLEPGNEVRFLISAPLGFRANSRVLRKFLAEAIENTSERLLSDQRYPDDFLILKPMHLPVKAKKEMQNELQKIIDKYAEASEVLYAKEANCQVALVVHATDEEPRPAIINLHECTES